MSTQPAVGVPPAVLLINPKYAHNAGAALRACACFGVGQLWWTGRRVVLDPRGGRLPREERMRGYRSVAMCPDDRAFDRFPRGTVPVAVELLPGAESLDEFVHPENAVYVFGPEDGSLPRPVRSHCQRFAQIPTQHCCNLAAAVYITLYDRRAKRRRLGMEPPLPPVELLAEVRGWGDDDFGPFAGPHDSRNRVRAAAAGGR